MPDILACILLLFVLLFCQLQYRTMLHFFIFSMIVLVVIGNQVLCAV